MNCFEHSSDPAIGQCKSCYKGLCLDCAVDGGNGLSCPGPCEQEVAEYAEMNERGKKIYGIGKYTTRVPSSGVLLWGLLAVLLWIAAGLAYAAKGRFDMEITVPAIFMTLGALIAYYSSKRTGLKC